MKTEQTAEDHMMRGNRRLLETSLSSLLIAVFLVLLWRNAWVGDDAYITFRTVDNFINGYGLTWNVAERVQAYTNPLWMMVVATFYAFTREVYLTVIFVSMAASLATILLVLFRLAPSMRVAVPALLCLCLSRSFVDYSTSGLENPLTHLLLTLFAVIYLRKTEPRGHKLMLLSLIAALGMVNRLDTALLFAPALVYSWWRDNPPRRKAPVVIGFLPLIVWEVFSLIYYGNLFPNSAYAKLSTGVGAGALLKQGLYYLWASVTGDPLVGVVIIAGLAIPVILRDTRMLPFSMGVLLYLVYTAWIGGDFMVGRFLAAPLLISIVALLAISWRPSRRHSLILAGVILVLGLINPWSPVYTAVSRDRAAETRDMGRGIIDERACYFTAAGLPYYNPASTWPNHRYVRLALKKEHPLTQRGTIGYFGFFSGPDVHVIDYNGLADPLLARLPIDDSTNWRIGHFAREIPRGYGLSLRDNTNAVADSSLAAYYDKVRLITRGPIFNWERLRSIVAMNLGLYDHHIETYVQRESQP